MKKPILATNIDGLLIKHEAFIKPHEAWFDRAIELTGDKSLAQWKGRKDYFKGVDEAMNKIMPDTNEEVRTEQARRWYQEDVVDYIRTHPEVVYKDVAETLKKLKPRLTLALVTTNSRDYIRQILEAAGLIGLYDLVHAIPLAEKPDKGALFKDFVRSHGEPKFYLAARSKEAFEECIKLGSLCVYATWDEFDPEVASMVKHVIKTPGEIEKLF